MQALKKTTNKPLKVNIDLEKTQEKNKEAEAKSITQPDFDDEIDEFRVSLVNSMQPIGKVD